MSKLCFWAGTMRAAPFERRLDAACAGGFASVSVFPMDCPDGRSCHTIRSLCEERGIRIAALDPFTRWLPGWEPPAGISPEFLDLVGCAEDAFFARAEALGTTAMTVLEPFGQTHETDELVESFSILCDRAAQSGVRVHLEFTPFSGIPDLASAWQVVRGANRDNGGLVFDTWHYLRGRPDAELLASIPGERLFVVQVSDAASEPTGSLVQDTMFHRRLPGEGDWDLTGLLAPLLAKPGIGEVGIEVLSTSLARLPPEEIGRRCGDALRRLIAAARSGVPG
jgi:sugar phosphate isomerase/epimerase